MGQTVRYLLDGQVREVSGIDPTRTVLDHLREDLRRTGTKEGCAEGDCGACTVVLGELDGDRIAWRAVNACILFVPTVDGKAILTVDGLAKDGKLAPPQQAMVDAHGSQCGFCTPGFVMSLQAMWLNGGEREPAAINDALAGNLCRCTGYGPIIAAAQAMGGRADACEDAAVARALKAIQPAEPLALDVTDRAGARRRYFAPRTVADLAQVLIDHPDATVLAGGTDVGLWVTKQGRSLPVVVSLGEVAELRALTETPDALRIGAGVRYAEAHARLGALWPDAGEVLRRLGSAQIRNSGTLGGNIANGSPIGDSPPLLIALDATLTLRRGDNHRTLPLEAFFLDYGKQDRQPGEFVEAVTVPLPKPDQVFRAYKITKRFDQDISAVCAGFRLTLQDGVVVEARLAFGGMAGVPRRAAMAEAALTGQPWTWDNAQAAAQALADDFKPLDDHRASAAYRLAAARGLVRKLWLETAGGESLRLVGAEVAHG